MGGCAPCRPTHEDGRGHPEGRVEPPNGSRPGRIRCGCRLGGGCRGGGERHRPGFGGARGPAGDGRAPGPGHRGRRGTATRCASRPTGAVPTTCGGTPPSVRVVGSADTAGRGRLTRTRQRAPGGDRDSGRRRCGPRLIEGGPGKAGAVVERCLTAASEQRIGEDCGVE